MLTMPSDGNAKFGATHTGMLVGDASVSLKVHTSPPRMRRMCTTAPPAATTSARNLFWVDCQYDVTCNDSPFVARHADYDYVRFIDDVTRACRCQGRTPKL